MNSVIRNVADLSADERHVYENVLGQALQDDQKVIVQLVDECAVENCVQKISGTNVLEPYAMWADFSDEEVAALESEILDRSESRPA
jgi:hypothetical protein